MKVKARTKKKKISRSKNIFYWCVLAFPLLQFLVFYIGVNLNSFALAFQEFKMDGSGLQYLKFNHLFDNFKQVFKNFDELDYLKSAFMNSIWVYVISLVVGLSLALLFSYYIYKKRTLSRFYKVILFLPSVISSITLVIIFKYFAENAIPEIVLKVFGKEIEGLLSNPNTELAAIMCFTIFTSFGIQTLIYSGAMSGISPEIVEAAKIDGITPLKEFFLITIPMIASTISVFVISSTATIFSNQMNLFSFYGPSTSNYSIWNIGYYMYRGIQLQENGLADYTYFAAFGLVMTLITIPVTMLVRYLFNKLDPNEE